MARVRVGLTGGIASGKSTVSKMLVAHGAVLIDGDQLAREVVEPGAPGLVDVIQRFGTDVLNGDGSLNRKKLGALIFADSQARADLDAIIHPLVSQRRAEIERAAAPNAVVVHDVPLLVELGKQNDFDMVVVVDVPERVQLRRLMRRNGLSEEEAEARIAAQTSRQSRLDIANSVIDNSGSKENTAGQVLRVWEKIKEAQEASE